MFKLNENNLQLTESKETNKKLNKSLCDVFYIILHGSKTDLEGIDMKQILINDLSIDLTQLKKQVANVLQEAVLYYIISWPGWGRRPDYIAGTLQFDHWFKDLQMFLTLKCNDIITNAETYINQAEADRTTDCGGDVSSYTLQIDGPAAILNSIAFDMKNGDVSVQVTARSAWSKLDLTELLNSPHVSVEVILPDIHITRANAHKIDRYLALSHEKHAAKSIDRIDYLSKASSDAQVYSYTFFRRYFIQFMYVALDIPGINNQRVKELHTIFNQFLGDIAEINIAKASMRTNTTVGFHIGDFTYSRQQITSLPADEMQSSSTNTLIFCENISPRVECTLHSFKAEQDLTDTITSTFKSLNECKRTANNPFCSSTTNLLLSINNSCLKYSCTFCKKTFSSSQALVDFEDHFLQNHKDEHSFTCNKCDQLFEMKFLAGNRWNHNCN